MKKAVRYGVGLLSLMLAIGMIFLGVAVFPSGR